MQKNGRKKSNISFIDFCAGIGAGRLGLENNGLICVGFSEIDKHAEQTYRHFFGQEEVNFGDLMKIDTSKIPDFDMMIAGFPCQTFSVVGKRKGMQDERGQVIYGLIKIMKDKNVKYFILENVKGLTNHDSGKTLRIILKELDDAGYNVTSKVLNSLDYGVPQMRERIYLVGIKKTLIPTDFKFSFPSKLPHVDVTDYLIDKGELEFSDKKQSFNTFTKYLSNKYNKGKFDMSLILKDDLLVLDTRQSDLRLYKNKVPTLRTGRHGILYVKNGKFRKLSGAEALLLQGFPKSFVEKVDGKVDEGHLLKQAGNAMTVKTIEAISKELFDQLKKYEY